ncbi:peptidyl-prolyl cis-trans isomerase [Meridianimarinicoccus sp. MJW13]|uniref:peptidylprolyl isomerase n=1 Tax=Meridianimarinicoccus sp. MJW13 TaxID=2720031 RepID=UPI001865BB66|nr:peptidylprolyl isomerase [Fluviibacterium sp. MJW13]
MTASETTLRRGGRPWRLTGWMRRLDPVALFFAAALAIFVANALLAPDTREVIDVTSEQAAVLVENHAALVGRPLSPQESAQVVERYINDEVLVREAVARGLHLSDAKLRARMLAKMDFLLMDEAPDPTPEELAALRTAMPDRYSLPETISFEHRFFGDNETASRDALAKLTAGSDLPEGAANRFWLGEWMEGYSEAQIQTVLGPEVFEAIAELPPDTWSGPLQTGRGWHVVRLTSVTGPQPLPAQELDRRLREDFALRHHVETRDKRILDMRKAYDIRLPSDALPASSGAAFAAGTR